MNTSIGNIVKQFNNLPLRVKLLLAFLSITIVAVGTATFFSYRVSRAGLLEQMGRNQRRLTSIVALNVGDVLAEQIGKLESYSLAQSLRAELNAIHKAYPDNQTVIEEQINTLDQLWREVPDHDPLIHHHLTNEIARDVQEFRKRFPSHTEVFITDKYGALVGSTNRTTDYMQADEVWWQAAWDDGKGAVYIGQPEYDESSQTFAIIMAVPIFERALGEGAPIIGILRTTFRVEETLLHLVERVQLGETGKGYLFVSDNAYLTEDALVEDAALSQFVTSSTDYGMMEYRGNDRFFSKADVFTTHQDVVVVADLDWIVVVSQARAEALQPLRVVRQTFLLITLGVLLLAGMLALLFERVIGTPIRTLTDMAQRIAVGDLAQQITLQRGDEIGLLAESFNTMARSLQELFETLEEKVRQRTAELADANEEIGALNQQLEEENLRLSTELEVTRRLQHMILPRRSELTAIKHLDIAGYMKPADEVGGDYYDVLYEDGRVKIGIGDVTDHGLESGVVMLMTQTAVRTLLNSGETDPVRFLDILNRTIYGNVQRMQIDRNLTLAVIDYEQGTVRLSGQHEEMIVIRHNGETEIVDTTDLGFPIGLIDDVTDFFDHTTLELAGGDGFVLYTDGVTEAENADGERYGLERLWAVAQQHWSQPADQIKSAIVESVHRHIDEHKVYDDITLLVVKQK